MQLVEQHIIKDDRFKDWCVKAKNLYNQSLYYWRQSIFKKIQYFEEYELVGLMQEFDDIDFRDLPANTSQQIIKNLFKNIKSWQKSRKEYTKNPSKFLSKPSLPKYKKTLSELYFTYQQVRLKNGFMYFPKMMQLKPIKTNVSDIQMCRVIPKSNHFVVEIIYNVEEVKEKQYNEKWLSIDIGLNNLATITSNIITPYIINGKSIKSVNSFYNKKKKDLLMKLDSSSSFSKRIRRLDFRRSMKIKNYIHNTSRYIVNSAVSEDITKIIVGKNERWKQNINIGKKSNRDFSLIPHATLIEQIKYKARLVGIEVVLTQEAYTSKCSALDLEPIRKHEKYLGKRKKRGLFVTSTGKLINADINGSLNIARLVLGDEIIYSDSIRSCEIQPHKIKHFV